MHRASGSNTALYLRRFSTLAKLVSDFQNTQATKRYTYHNYNTYRPCDKYAKRPTAYEAYYTYGAYNIKF